LFPNFGVDAVGYAGGFYRAWMIKAFLSSLKMLRGGGLGKAKFFHEAAGGAGVLLDQVLQDGNPGRVGYGFSHVSNVVLLFGKKVGFCGPIV
jgi:hypothetical protein